MAGRNMAPYLSPVQFERSIGKIEIEKIQFTNFPVIYLRPNK